MSSSSRFPARCLVALVASVGGTLPIAGSVQAAPSPRIASAADVETAVARYGAHLRSVYLTGSGPTGATALSSALPADERLAITTAQPIAATFRRDGASIGAASVTTSVMSWRPLAAGGASAQVRVEVSVQAGADASGLVEPSSWSDVHDLTLAGTGPTLRVIEDTTQSTAAEPVAETLRSERWDDTTLTPPAPTSLPAAASADPQPTQLTMSALATLGVIKAAPSPGYPQETRIDAQRFRAYALKWTGAPYDGDDRSDFNPAYPVMLYKCANFASQVLHNGGWRVVGGSPVQYGQSSVWSPRLVDRATGRSGGPSLTWIDSAALLKFAWNTGTYGKMDNIWNARTGDLLFFDWDPNNRRDGYADHTMVVSGYTTTGVPLISQKTPNRHHIRLTTSLALARAQRKVDIAWWALRRL